MTTVCPSCGWAEESAKFCTECGASLQQQAVASDVGHAADAAALSAVAGRPAQPPSPDLPAKPRSGWSTAGKVIDGVGSVMTFIIGLCWFLLGLVALIASFPTGIFAGIGGGILCMVYGVWLMKPGGWKFVIY